MLLVTNMSPQLTTEQLQALGMADMSGNERERMYARIGKLVFDGAILRLLETLTAEQMSALNYTIESYRSFDGVLEYIETSYPQFATYLQQEQEKFVELFVGRVRTVGL